MNKDDIRFKKDDTMMKKVSNDCDISRFRDCVNQIYNNDFDCDYNDDDDDDDMIGGKGLTVIQKKLSEFSQVGSSPIQS